MAILIDDFRIDASLSESHEFQSEVTSYPVEKGGNISDNARPLPIIVTIDGIVSDTPIGAVEVDRAAARTFAGVKGLPSEAALAHLLGIRDARLPVTIATSLKTYDNMVLQNLTIPRESPGTAALLFTAVFQQVILVSNTRVTIKIKGRRGGGKPKFYGPGPSTPLADEDFIPDPPRAFKEPDGDYIDSEGYLVTRRNGVENHTNSWFKSPPINAPVSTVPTKGVHSGKYE